MAPTTNRLSISKTAFWTLIVFIAVLILTCTYLFAQYRRSLPAAQPDPVAETQKVVAEIKQLMIIPDDSGAVLATIADKTKLAGQKFFELAQNGDDVVLFPAMGKAVLYRPTIHRIIDVGPFNSQANQSHVQQPANTPLVNAPSPAPTVVKKSATSTLIKKTR